MQRDILATPEYLIQVQLATSGLPLNQSGVVIIPDGDVPLADGSKLKMDKAGADRIIARFKEQGVDLQIDLEHQSIQTQRRIASGEAAAPAPAYGWVKALRYEQGKGLLGDIDWLEEGAELVESEKYKYLSPVIRVNPKTGDVFRLLSVAITNTPAIRHMGQLKAASEFLLKENDMPDPIEGGSASPEQLAGEIKMLLIQKGVELGEDADLTSIMQGVKAFLMDDTGGDAGDDAEVGAAEHDDDEDKNASDPQSDRTDEVKALSDTVTELKAQIRERDAKAIVKAASEGPEAKLNPNDKDSMAWALAAATKDPEGFAETLKHMAVAAPPQGSLSRGAGSPPKGGTSHERELVDAALKEHDNNYAQAYASCQKKLLNERIEAGMNRRAAEAECSELYPEIFG